MTAGTVIAGALTLALIGTAFLYVRERLKPIHDPSHDDADFDPRLADFGRRVGGSVSFHPPENEGA